MFCKECGKSISDDSKFCSFCGSKVSPLNANDNNVSDDRIKSSSQSSFHNTQVQDSDHSYVSMSNAAGSDKSRDNSGSGESTFAEVNLKRTAHFNWDLAGFPSDDSKADRKVRMEWGDVLSSDNNKKNKRKSSISRDVKFENPLENLSSDGINDYTSDNQEENEKSLQEFIFGNRDDESSKEDSADSLTVNKFYTFNKKNEEFQRLLDKEYEKLKEESAYDISDSEDETEYDDSESYEDDYENLEYSRNDELEEPDMKDDENDEENEYGEGNQAEEIAEANKYKSNVSDWIGTSGFKIGVIDSESDQEVSSPNFQEDNSSGNHSTPSNEDRKTEETTDGLEVVGVVQPEQGMPSVLPEGGVLEIPESEELSSSEELSHDGKSAEERKQPRRGRADNRAKTKFDFQAIFDDEYGNSDNSIRKTLQAGKKSKKKPKKKAGKIAVPENMYEKSADDESFVSENINDGHGGNKKSKALAVLGVIFYLILTIVIVILGIKLVAPESTLAHKIDLTYDKITSYISKNKGNTYKHEEYKTIDDWIEEAKPANQNIANVKSDETLKVDITNKEFNNVDLSRPFSDSIWYTSEDGRNVYYGGAVVRAVVAHYSDANSVEGGIAGKKIETLRIGEIRTGEFGFFVKVGINNPDDKIERTLYIEPQGNVLKVINAISDKTDENTR
ncbi:zinc-ribbon domain-containing protein [Eubacteriales bacterium KG127]